jgi:drug/metabolite transporter (DMT)-like permease
MNGNSVEGVARAPGALTPLRALGLLALCLLASSTWLIDQQWPITLPLPTRLTLHNLILAVIIAPFAWRHLVRNRSQSRPYAQLAIASICLLSLPALLVDIARSSVSSVTVTELFAILPIAVVVLTPHLASGSKSPPDTTHLLVPAFIGLAGTLLLLPFALPDSPRRAACQALTLLAVVLSAIAAMWMHRLLAAFTVLEAILLCCLANAAFSCSWLLISSLVTSTPLLPPDLAWQTFPPEFAIALLYDLPLLALLLWLMRDLAPTRLSVRFLAVPQFTYIGGYLLFGIGLSLKSIVGVLLLAFAILRLATAPNRTGEPRLILH